MPTDSTHPADAAPTHPLDQPVSAETGAKVLALLALTEGEALQIIAAKEVGAAQLKEVQNVDLHALSLGVDEDTIHALVTDSKVDLGANAADFEERCIRVRHIASAEDKIQHLSTKLHAAARIDASTVQEVVSMVVGQIRERARAVPAVKKTYATLLAYHHARFPGTRGSRADAVPAEVKK